MRGFTSSALWFIALLMLPSGVGAWADTLDKQENALSLSAARAAIAMDEFFLADGTTPQLPHKKVEVDNCMDLVNESLSRFKTLTMQDAPRDRLARVRDNIMDDVSRCVDAADYVIEVNRRSAMTTTFDAKRAKRCDRLNIAASDSWRINELLDGLANATLDARDQRLRVYGDLGLASHLAHTMHTRAKFLRANDCHAPGQNLPEFMKQSDQRSTVPNLMQQPDFSLPSSTPLRMDDP